MSTYKLYTDGACSNNGKIGAIGGWAYAIVDAETDQLVDSSAGRSEGTTNQQMEITSLIEGLRAVLKLNPQFAIVDVFSDSAYCINAINDRWIEKWINNGWQTSNKTDVKNQELWRELYPLTQDPRFRFIKVKGHSDNFFNNLVDEMAVRAKDDVYSF